MVQVMNDFSHLERPEKLGLLSLLQRTLRIDLLVVFKSLQEFYRVNKEKLLPMAD